MPVSSHFSEDGFFLHAVFFAGLQMKSARLSNLSEIGPISLYLVNMRFFFFFQKNPPFSKDCSELFCFFLICQGVQKSPSPVTGVFT